MSFFKLDINSEEEYEKYCEYFGNFLAIEFITPYEKRFNYIIKDNSYEEDFVYLLYHSTNNVEDLTWVGFLDIDGYPYIRDDIFKENKSAPWVNLVKERFKEYKIVYERKCKLDKLNKKSQQKN